MLEHLVLNVTSDKFATGHSIVLEKQWLVGLDPIDLPQRIDDEANRRIRVELGKWPSQWVHRR